jgi:trehalose 6-phosphate synthase/phosphatase
MTSSPVTPRTYDFVVVSNRLPVDRVSDPASTGGDEWRRSPGGLVTALHPIMQRAGGAWVGWHGAPDEVLTDFDHDGMRLVPVALSAAEVSTYYEGFSNATLWPLFHDVIAPPEYHRTWWDAYREVNQRFARECARVAAPNATVWVQDYQLLLVPALLRQLRPDVKIGFFLHIPFPPAELFAQLPWRRAVLEGMLGASLLGFQRESDTANFLRCVRRFAQRPVKSKQVQVEMSDGCTRHVRAETFPISIDTNVITTLAQDPAIIERAQSIRESLGNRKIILGVDRLDYTKGIRHRIKAYGELLTDRSISVEDVALIQVASPSRERVSSYVQLREDVELAVGRINGNFDTLEHTTIRYLHHSYPMTEMVALYLAADVMLVTALRDGMNLVAKEYVAARLDDTGALILSEFAGAADDLPTAILTNPHDIGGMKEDILRALTMTAEEAQRRMKRMRRQVLSNDIDRWSSNFLEQLEKTIENLPPRPDTAPTEASGEPARVVVANADETHGLPLTDDRRSSVRRQLAQTDKLLVALDFDGVVAPIVPRAEDARPLPRTKAAIDALTELPNVQVAFVSGRSLASLRSCASPGEKVALIGSHGAEQYIPNLDRQQTLTLTKDQERTLARAEKALKNVARKHNGAWVEIKPAGVVLHVRQVKEDDQEQASVEAMQRVYVEAPSAHVSRGKSVVEVAVLKSHKGEGIEALREYYEPTSVLFMGDDVTDENGFAALAQGPGHPDVGVKVGPGATGAAVRLNSPEEVAEFLEEILADRS